MVSNPLAPGSYVVDLWSPTDATPVRDGVPVFNRWREANAARVRVIHAESWNTHPRRTRVKFDVVAPPGAWPFGQLGPPAPAAVVGAVPTFVDVVEFLFDPLAGLEGSVAEAAGQFLHAGLAAAAPELKQVRAAISITRANIAIIRATLEAIRNGTAPDPASAIAACKNLIRESLELLTAAMGSVAVDFPRRMVSTLIDDLRALDRAIEEAPARALRALGQAAKDVILPLETANIGGGLLAVAALWALYSGKRSGTTDTVMIIGAAALVLGGSSLLDNLLHPFDHAGKAARDLKG